ncbi:MAG: shikimate kinase [Sphingobacteriales bacterium]|nr:shikimate kinase [Sphingobacteriales bacterium]
MLIFLVGFMGTGKSHWGKIWSQANQIPFVDLDDAIETAEGKSVAAIFELNGEDYFRKLETATLRSFAHQKNIIISCGGGTPCFNNNMQWMNENGVTVFIATPAAIIAQRVMKEQEKRPLLKGLTPTQLLDFIEQKLLERAPFYSQAKITLIEAAITEETFLQITAA